MRPAWRFGWVAAPLLAITALAPSALAQETEDVDKREFSIDLMLNMPQCATTCFLKTQVDNNMNGNTDNATAFEQLCAAGEEQDATTACVLKSCSTKESLLARNMTATACDKPIRDDSRTYTNLAISLSIISTLCVLQRFIAKFLAENLRFGMDDYMVLLAALVQAPMAAIGVEGGVRSGLGRDIWTLTFDQITDFNFFLYVFTVLYFFNIAVVKLCFLTFYLTVFQKQLVRRYLWVTIAFAVMFGLTFTILGVFQCRPISFYWERWTGEVDGYCVNVSAVAWANGGISIGLDLWMFAIPLSQVPQLSLDWKKKLEVSVMFCVGLFVTVISCVRLESLVTNDIYSPNATWVKRMLAIWSTVEINVGIICACLPSIRTLVVTFVGRIPAKFGGKGNRSSSSKHLSEKEAYHGNGRAFGTVSRTVAEPTENAFSFNHGAGIRMQRECHVEYEDARSSSGDEARLVKSGSMGKLSSSSGSLDKMRHPDVTDHRW